MSQHWRQMTLCWVASAALLSGCGGTGQTEQPQFDGDASVIDEAGLNNIMLTMADPAQASAHFRRLLASEPDNPEHLRGLAVSLIRAKRTAEAAPVFERLIDGGKGTTNDRLLYAESLVAGGDIESAETQLGQVPPEVATYKRYLLEAIVADNNKNWTQADDHYDSARQLTARPAAILNNWGMSKMARGELTQAANLFQEAITFDPKLFQAKNNLITARGRVGNFRLPVIPMTEVEEAMLLYNLGILAVRQDKTDTAKGLFSAAVETHPQHYSEAIDALASLGSSV